MNTKELDFAYKVRHALNEKTENLPENIMEGLASSRKIALSRKKSSSPLKRLVSQSAVAGHIGQFFNDPAYFWLSRLGAVITMAVLISGLVGIYHVEEQNKIKEVADMDIAVLSDELPPHAYLDQGFKAYLQKRGS